MRNIKLYVTAVMLSSSFVQEALAIPSFSRQTNMACKSCHAQHAPILNGFGQAYKAAGYPILVSQSKIEGERLSLPGSIYTSLLLKAGYRKSNGADTDIVPGDSTNSGQWQAPEQFNLSIVGRINENIGFYLEGDIASIQLISGFRLPATYNIDIAKLSVIPFMTEIQGASYGYEQASTGAVRNVRWAEHRKEISAQQYVGTDGAATGVAFVAQSDIGYINFSRWAPGFMARSGEAQTFRSNYLRIAATPTIGDWASHAGVQVWKGSNFAPSLLVTPLMMPVDTRAAAVDFQATGQVGEKDLSLYFTWAKSPGGSPSKPNILNVGNSVSSGNNPVGPADPSLYRVNDRKAWIIGAEYSWIQHVLHIGTAYRRANSGGATGSIAGANPTDNAITLTFVYNISQNAQIHLNQSFYSGTLYNTPQPNGDRLTTVIFEASW